MGGGRLVGDRLAGGELNPAAPASSNGLRPPAFPVRAIAGQFDQIAVNRPRPPAPVTRHPVRTGRPPSARPRTQLVRMRSWSRCPCPARSHLPCARDRLSRTTPVSTSCNALPGNSRPDRRADVVPPHVGRDPPRRAGRQAPAPIPKNHARHANRGAAVRTPHVGRGEDSTVGGRLHALGRAGHRNGRTVDHVPRTHGRKRSRSRRPRSA